MLKRIFEQYKHALLLLYFPFYMIAFNYLQKVVPDRIHIIDCAIDRCIPFCEYFVVPYLLWFAYMGITGIYFLFFDKKAFCKMMYMGMIGMTVFLIISFIYPNGLEIRPTEFVGDNIFIRLTKLIYASDPARNVLPSIHVFNSAGIFLCMVKSDSLKDKVFIIRTAFFLTVAIVLSTMFLKQHSIFDVISAMILVSISYEMVYNYKYRKQLSHIRTWYLIHKKKLRYKYKVH